MSENEPGKLPQVECALICEDIRKEITGKDILIGVLGDDITAVIFPFNITVALYLRLKFFKEGSSSIEFGVVESGGSPLTPVAKADLIAKSTQRTTIAYLLGITFPIVRAGEIKFQWRLSGTDQWTDLVALNVRQGRVDLLSQLNVTPMTTV